MKISVRRSAVIDAPIDRVWAILRDFNSHGSWHPAVDGSRMENDLDGDVVGGVRRFSLSDGAEIREQLLHHSDARHTLTYSILDSNLPLFDWVATLRLRPVTDGGHTFLDWRCQFRTSRERGAELEDLVGQKICETGIAGLRKLLFDTGAPSSRPVTKTMEATVPDVPEGDPLPCHALVRAQADSPEAVSLIEVTVPPPKPGQVRIGLTAMGINPMAGQVEPERDEAKNACWIPSIEGVGEVIDVGPHVHGLFPGDRVAYIDDAFGAYAEIRCVDADACLHLPDAISNDQASILFKGVAAQVLLSRIFKAGPGSAIMLRSLHGGLGHMVGQWAKTMGMTVLATVSSTDEARFSRDHGCDYPLIDVDGASLRNEVMRVTNGRGVDYWADHGNAVQMDVVFSCMARFGHIAVLDAPEGDSMPVDVAGLRQRSLTLTAPRLIDYLRRQPYLQRLANRLFTEIEKRSITPAIETIPISRAQAVFQPAKTRQFKGAFTLVPG